MLDETTFRSIYAAHAPALYLLAQRLMRDRNDASDAVQETWLRVARRPDALLAAESPRAWLCGVLINCCRELRRRGRAEVPAEEGSYSGSPSARVDLETAVRSLPEGFRDVIVLHDIEGYTHEEIGRLLDVDSSTSRSQLSRARERLRRKLEGYHHE